MFLTILGINSWSLKNGTFHVRAAFLKEYSELLIGWSMSKRRRSDDIKLGTAAKEWFGDANKILDNKNVGGKKFKKMGLLGAKECLGTVFSCLCK